MVGINEPRQQAQTCNLHAQRMLISAFLTHFMTSFGLVVVLFIPLSSIFFLTFPSYFIQLIILYHSDTLLDFRIILTKFLVHMLSRCFLML